MARIGLIGNNSVGYVEKLIGIWNNGDCAVLLDFRIPMKTLTEMMREADVSVCIVGNSLYQAEIEHLPCDIQFVPFDDSCKSGVVLPSEIIGQFKDNYSSNEAVVIYSSGTTGKSKGIILSHFAINTNADAIIDYMNPTQNDCILITKTLCHSSTLTGELLVSLKSRTKLIVAPAIISSSGIFKIINRFCVTLLFVNPTILSLLSTYLNNVNCDVSSIRAIYVSGSILNDGIYSMSHRVFAGIPIYNVYGLSEAAPRVTAQRADCCKSNSVGKPIKGIKIVIIGCDGKPVQNGTSGNVYINTQTKYSGYISGNERFVHNDFKGWLNTGDIGYINGYGELVIVGRADSIIIHQSHNILPESVENQLMRLSSDIATCRVFVLDDDLCCEYTTFDKKEIDRKKLKSILDDLKKVLPTYEIPMKFLYVDKINGTLSGKIIRRNYQNGNNY